MDNGTIFMKLSFLILLIFSISFLLHNSLFREVLYKSAATDINEMNGNKNINLNQHLNTLKKTITGYFSVFLMFSIILLIYIGYKCWKLDKSGSKKILIIVSGLILLFLACCSLAFSFKYTKEEKIDDDYIKEYTSKISVNDKTNLTIGMLILLMVGVFLKNFFVKLENHNDYFWSEKMFLFLFLVLFFIMIIIGLEKKKNILNAMYDEDNKDNKVTLTKINDDGDFVNGKNILKFLTKQITVGSNTTTILNTDEIKNIITEKLNNNKKSIYIYILVVASFFYYFNKNHIKNDKFDLLAIKYGDDNILNKLSNKIIENLKNNSFILIGIIVLFILGSSSV
jgi:hypothetical protein